METTSAEDILLRIDTLKELGGDCGRGGLRRWILLDGYNKAVTKNLPHAVQLVELLGVRDESMKQYFGSLWRRAFRNKKKGLGHGFTARVFFNANFISIGDNVGSDAPHTGNIVHRGSDTAMAIRDHVENSIAAAAEDEDTEENNTEDSITAGEGQSSDFNIDDYKSRVVASPMVLMPHGIEVISKHGGIGGIYCTLRTCPILVFAFNRNRAKKRKRPPSEWSLENAISYMKEEIHHNGGVGNTQLQSFLHSTLHLLPKSGDSISLKFFDTQNRTRKSTLQFMKRQRTCDVNASDKSKNDYVSRVAKSIVKSTVDSLGSNYSAALATAVFNKIGERFNMVLLDAGKTCFNFAELVAAGTYCKTSLNGTCRFIQSLINLRPNLRRLIFPTGFRVGMSNVINSGNLQFETTELELVTSKKKNLSAMRIYWCLVYLAHQMEKLIESSIVDRSFQESIVFSKLQDAIVVVFGIDKAAENTGAAIRVANRKNGNSSDYTQLLAAVMNAAECHTNFVRTFFSEKSPLKNFLQSIVNDWYQSLIGPRGPCSWSAEQRNRGPQVPFYYRWENSLFFTPIILQSSS